MIELLRGNAAWQLRQSGPDGRTVLCVSGIFQDLRLDLAAQATDGKRQKSRCRAWHGRARVAAERRRTAQWAVRPARAGRPDGGRGGQTPGHDGRWSSCQPKPRRKKAAVELTSTASPTKAAQKKGEGQLSCIGIKKPPSLTTERFRKNPGGDLLSPFEYHRPWQA